MSNWNTHDIVEILVKDEALLEARRRFARFLYIPGDSLKEFEDDYRENKDLYSYFCKVLEKWKSMNDNKATVFSLSNILKENGFAASAERLSTLPIGSSASVTKLQVKEPVFNFVGREAEIKELNELFIAKKACVVLSSAMGGKGKTELCRRFIQQLPKDVETLVTWISGDGLQQFQQSLSEISQEMNVSTTNSAGKPLSVAKIIENISTKRKSKWVVIIDNVDEVFPDFFVGIDVFLRNEAFVVITSRKSDIESEKHIFLKDLADKDAWEFVRSSLDQIPPQELIIALCKSLQNYPLALQQAVSFIKHKQRVKDESYGINEYLKEFNSDKSQVLDHESQVTGYEQTVLRVFRLTLSKILSVNEIPSQKPISFFKRIVKFHFLNKNITKETKNHYSPALTLLQIVSLVQPDGIENEFLKKLFAFFSLEELFESSISTLKSFSLITPYLESVISL